MLKLIPQRNEEAFGRWLGHEGGLLMNGISALMKETSEGCLPPSVLCEDTGKSQPSATWKRALSGHWISLDWTLRALKLWEIDVCCISHPVDGILGFPGGSVVKNPPANPGDTGDVVWCLGQEGHLEDEIATYSSILSWEIPWTQEPGGLQFMRSQISGQNWIHAQWYFVGAAWRDQDN